MGDSVRSAADEWNGSDSIQSGSAAMKIYTGGGDKGKTSLFSGERVPKHHLRIEAYGDIDELNSLLGAVTSYLPATEQAVRNDLDLIQSNLFMAGAWLATTPDSTATAYLLPFSPEHARGWRSVSMPCLTPCPNSKSSSCRADSRWQPGRMWRVRSADVANAA